MADRNRSPHRNKERTVKCPIEECDAEPLARGVHLHVRQSDGSGHGPSGEVPDGVSFENLETVGERDVTMAYPEERGVDSLSRLCPYCLKPFKGTNGVLIHLGQKAGQGIHPENCSEKVDPRIFPAVKTNRNDSVVGVIDEGENSEISDAETKVLRILFIRVAKLMARGKLKEARELRRIIMI